MNARFSCAASAALALALFNVAASRADPDFSNFPFAFRPYPYPGHGYSYNVAYGYDLPFTPQPDMWHFPRNWEFYRKFSPFGRRHSPPAGPAADAPGPAPCPDGGSGGTALIEAQTPADAELWFDGAKTTQQGAVRVFESPPLEKGKEFRYEVRARWVQGGKPVEQKQTVVVQGGGRVHVEFPKP